jgi:minor extracellular serine protease Vpr
LFSLTMVLALILTSVAVGKTPAAAVAQNDGQAPSRFQEVPEEVRDAINGLTIDEFLANYKGPVPHALQELAAERVTVVVEMEGSPVAVAFGQAQASRRPLSATAQRQLNDSLKAAQAPVVSSLKGLGGSVISQYTKVYNGILVNLPAAQISTVKNLPGVKAVHPAPVHYPALGTSVPLIRADEVVTDLGYDGTGMTIAIIDTGIDYTHASLGGSGDPADYASNNPNVIEGMHPFPTAKVIGGYDFAGTDYDGSNLPVPDADPLDENGHGTHVASTSAGIDAGAEVSEGVAPNASLYALKVFGAEGSTNLVVDAIEWAMDPNGDLDLSDHVDVINMSLGADYGPDEPTDVDIIASNNASAAGVVVVASAGNAGNTPYIVGSPSVAESVISVAASTTGAATGPTIQAPAPPATVEETVIYQPASFDNNTGHYTSEMIEPLIYAGSVAAEDILCDITGLPTDAMAGSIALIQRGTCDFSTKVNNAAALGAVGAIIFNHETGGDILITMIGVPVDIPAAAIGHTNGLNLIAYEGVDIRISPESEVTTILDPFTPADTVADFSSRGPSGYASMLKPDITAPGVAIFAASMGGGTAGVSMGGTSMAAPHVAGVAALIKQANPGWTPAQVKTAMMNSAVDLADPFSMQIPLQGAGRVDAYEAVTADSFLTADEARVSLNWGLIELTESTYATTTNITLANEAAAGKSYDVSWEFGSGSFESGFDLTLPNTVAVGAGPAETTIPVDLALDATLMETYFDGVLEEYYGYIILTNQAVATDTLRIPFYTVVEPYTELTVTGTLGAINSGEVEITHSGPISSSLWAYPLLAMDVDEVDVGNEGDVRTFGMDYMFNSATYGDVFAVAINTYGPWHTPQPYFNEFDLYIDVDGDTNPDFINFNFNYGWFTGGDDTDLWVVVQVEVASGLLYLGSPYTIFTDYNTGYMEWALPAEWNGLFDDTDFDYELYGFDRMGNYDFGAGGYFDYAASPFAWDLTNFEPGPADPTATLSFSLADPDGYVNNAPLGLMIIDLFGKAGEGQVYPYMFTFESPYKIIMPIIQSN